MHKFFKSLYLQVIIAIIIGILVGHFYPNIGTQLKPLADAFIRLVKMMIAPVIFCTVVNGIAGMEDLKKVGRVGLKAILYFEIVSNVALLIGLVVVNIMQPGKGMHIDVSTLDTSALPKTSGEDMTTIDFLVHIIPDNIVDAIAKNNLLQVLFFSVLFGIALSKIGTKAKPVQGIIQSFADALFALIHLIMKVAPLGALGAIAFTVGKYGLGTLQSLGSLMLTFYITCIIFIVVILGGILKMIGFNIFKLLRYIKDELFIVLGTSSSESALPSVMEKLEKAGCSKPVVGLVMPTGYSFNLDGTGIYLTMAAVFLAQATDTPLTIANQISLLVVLMLVSNGAAGVTGSGFIILASTVPALGSNIPIASLALILGIDRFMSEARALTNIIGNTVATIVVAKWEKEIDPELARKYLT
jgi:aerobic C4-dicarboxylate transport protein